MSSVPPQSLLQVKGSAIRARLLWVKEQYGQHGLRELEAALSAAGRNAVRGDIDPRAWHNWPLYLELCTTIDRKWGQGDGSLNLEMARFSAHVNTPTMYQAFIRLGSVDWVLRKGAKLFSEHFSTGEFVVRHEPGAKVAEGEIVGFPQPHIALLYAVIGFAVGCVELSGGKDVRGEVVSARAYGAERDIGRVTWT